MSAPYHLAGYAENIDSAALQGVTALADGAGSILTTVATDFYLADARYRHVAGAWVGGVSVTRGRLVSSQTFSSVRPEIRPLERVAVPVGHRALNERFGSPRALVAGERVGVEVSEDGAGATQMFALLMLSERAIHLAPPADCAELGATRAAGGITTRVWSNITLTLRDTLPPGRYTVGGMQAEGTNLIAARIAFPAGGARPGVIGRALRGVGAGNVDERFRRFRLGGAWGEFTSENLPTVDVLVDGVDTDMEFVLDVQRVGGLPGFGDAGVGAVA